MFEWLCDVRKKFICVNVFGETSFWADFNY